MANFRGNLDDYVIERAKTVKIVLNDDSRQFIKQIFRVRCAVRQHTSTASINS
ncbi:hypothetical protein NIES37_36290 [Tolypothrix tenuis PCC 7101]|uniref:Uncharacterized protein n=1 Tax=Tolypothrix tenuis PCC 7101 TaxID=231146 RepID=A0A1Z4N1R0_9CYAN|nr:hypothetical protein NIES37_36290 [Tolypothrix tenuis PCC 7101]BAZ76432.1 hypothetical protein NIES50_50300 [Aulosira laxa NIES-50]